MIDINQENDTIIKKKHPALYRPFHKKQSKNEEQKGWRTARHIITEGSTSSALPYTTQNTVSPWVCTPQTSRTSFLLLSVHLQRIDEKKRKNKTRSKNNFRKIKIAILNLPKNLDKHCQNFIKVLPCEFPRVALTSLTVEGFNGRTSCDLSELMIGLKSFCEFFLTAKVTADCSRQLIIGM